MTISTVASGQTFEVWLQATNDTITEINNADSSGGANRLVRYDSTGGIALSNFNTNALTLETGVTVNAISTSISSSPTDLEISTSKAIFDYVEGGKHNLYDAIDGQTKMVVDYNTGAKIFVRGTEVFGATANAVQVTANTTFDRNVHVIGNLTVEGENVSIATTQLTVEDQIVTFNKGNMNGDANNSGFEIEGPGNTVVSSFLYNNGGYDLSADSKSVRFVPALASLTVNFDQDISTVSNVHFNAVNIADTFIVPTETATPATGIVGQIHFNTNDQTFEGFDGSVWGSLGGVSTPDKSTRIVADRTFRNLQFRANNVDIATFTDRNLGFTGEVSVTGNTAITGDLTVSGETFIHDALLVDGDVSANGSFVALGSNSITLKDYAVTLTQDVTGIANTLSADDQTVPTTNTVFAAINDVAGQVSSLDLAVIQDTSANTSVRTSGNTVYFVANSTSIARFNNTSSTFDNDVVLKGNLTVLGTQTILDVTDVEVQDKNIVLNKGGSTTTAFDSGISVDGTNAYFQMLDANTWHIVGHDGEGKLEADGALTLRVDGIDSIHMNTAYASFAGLSEGVVLPTASGATSPAAGTIRFNDSDQQFQGYFGGTWQGLGGVITPDKKTSIVADSVNHALEFTANTDSVATITKDNTEIRTPKITLFSSALTGIATVDENAGNKLPTAAAVNTAISTLRTNLTSSIAVKADTSIMTTALSQKANTPGSTPTASGKYLAWSGTGFEERTIPASFNVPSTSSDGTNVLKWNHTTNTFFIDPVSTVDSVDGANIATPASATGGSEVLVWTGNSFINKASSFATNAYVDGKMPSTPTPTDHAIIWNGGWQEQPLNYVKPETLAAKFPSANTPDGYVVQWRQDLNQLQSVDGFATKDHVSNLLPGGGAAGSGASGTQVTKWTGSQFENVDLSSVSVSSEGFSNSLTPQIAATSTEALQWDGEKFVHANFANTDYVDQEVSTRATQAWVTTQIDFKADQSEVDTLKIDKANAADVNLALGQKLSKANFVRPDSETSENHYLIWTGSTFDEREMSSGIGVPEKDTANNQMVVWTMDGGGKFQNVNVSTVQVSSADANNVVPTAETPDSGAVIWTGEKFENQSGFATQQFVNSKLPLAYSNTGQALVWTGDGFRNRDLSYVSSAKLDTILPASTTASGFALKYDYANSQFVTSDEFAKKDAVQAMFPASANSTLSNQVLKWSGSELYNANVSTKSVTPEEANNVVPGEDSGTYSVIQWRNDKFENVDGLFARSEAFNTLQTNATTKTYVDTTFTTKSEKNLLAAKVESKATLQDINDAVNDKATKPVIDANTPGDHYLRWDGSKFEALGFKAPVNTPANATADDQIVVWDGSKFVNANVSTVEVSSQSANNVVPTTKTGNTGAVQWTGSKFVNRDGFATEDYVSLQMPTSAERSTTSTEVLKWTGTAFKKTDLTGVFATPADINDKLLGSANTTDEQVLQWRGGKLEAMSAPFATKTELDLMTSSLGNATQDDQVVKWSGSEFEHANVANVVITSQGFDADVLTPSDFSTRSQALQWKDGKFKHAFFVTAADLSNAVSGTATTEYVDSKLSGYTNSDDLNAELAYKVNISDYNADQGNVVTKPADGTTPDNFYLYWDGYGLRSREFTSTIGTPTSSQGSEIIRWNAETQEFYNAELSTSGYTADANIITPAMTTANNEILVWNGSGFENRTGMATVKFVNEKFLSSSDVTQVNQALAWGGSGFVNKDLDEHFASQEYVMDRMPGVTTANTQVLHWDNQQQKLVEYTGFATKKSIDDMVKHLGAPGDNQVLSWTGDRFEYVTISTVTIQEEDFDANTFMPATASTSAQALQWNGSEFVHGEFANTGWVEDKLEEKVEQTYVDQGLSGKAEKNYVDNRLTTKANTQFVLDNLAEKLNLPNFENSNTNSYLRMSGGQLVQEEFTSTVPTPADDSSANQVVRWIGGEFVNADLSLTAVETEDANNVLPIFGSNPGDVIQWNAVDKKFKNSDKFALKSYINDKLPNDSVTTSTTQALGWKDGKAYVLELETEAGLVKKSYVDSFLPTANSSNTEVIQMIAGRFTNTDEFARKDYVDEIKPIAITKDNQRLKWTGYAFENANVTTRTINAEEFDANTFMPDDASTSMQALQWTGSEFVHGEFANVSFVENKLADKAGKTFVNSELEKRASLDVTNALDVNKADKSWVETQLEQKVRKPMQTTDDHYLAYDVTSGWVEKAAAVAVKTPEDQTEDNQMVVWTGSEFVNANISEVEVSTAEANNVIPTTVTANTGVVQWNGSKFVNRNGFATEQFVNSKLPTETTLANSVLRWSAAGKFVNQSVNFLTQEKLNEKFPNANTLSTDILQYQGGELVPVSGFAMLKDIEDIKPEGGDSSPTGVLKWAEGRLQHTSLVGGIDPTSFNFGMTPPLSSVSNEALQWTKNDDGSGRFTHATFANAIFVANKMAETSSAVKEYGDAKFATIDTVSTIQTSLDDAVTTSELATQLSDFAAKPGDSLLSGADTYLYWNGSSFESGQLPDETPVPNENTQDGYILTWDADNGRFVNKEVAVTALDAKDVKNVAPGSTSNDDQALQWKRVGDIDKFQQRVFITPEKLTEKLPATSETFTSADYDALQWNGTSFINRTLQFVKPQELRDRMPAGSSGTTGVVVSDANGNLSNSTEFARKDFVKAYLPENGEAQMTGTNQMLVWNGSKLENVTKTDVQLSETDADSILPGESSNEHQCVYWNANSKKLEHREVANINYVDNAIDGLDFTQILSGSTSASISGNTFNVVNSSGSVLRVDTAKTTIGSDQVDVNAIKLTDTSTVVDGIDPSVSASATKLPTSNAVQSYVTGRLNSFGASLSSDKINDTNDGQTFIQTNDDSVEIIVDNAQAIVAKETQVEIHQDAIFGTSANKRDVTIHGNLNVTGASTQINVVDLEVQDSNILLNKGGNSVDGAGISVEANGNVAAHIQLDESGTFKAWEISDSNGDANISASSGNTFGVFVESTRQLHVESTTTSIANDLDVSGATTLRNSLDVTGQTQITGDLSATGTTTSGGKLTVNSGGLDVTGQTQITGDLSATGQMSSATLNVAGVSTLSGNVTLDNGSTLTVAGATTLQSSLNVGGASTLNDDVTIANGKALTVGGISTLTDDVSLGAGLQIGATQRVEAISNNENEIALGANTTLMTAHAIAGKLATLSDSLDAVSDNLAGTTSLSNNGAIISANADDTIDLTAPGGVTISHALTAINGTTTLSDLTATSIAETSSAALKTNVTQIDGALDKIMALRGVEFNWINNRNGNKEYGLIAEDVAQVAPNLVSYEQEEAKGVKYSKMVSLLIEAMKEQQKEIDELKKKLN